MKRDWSQITIMLSGTFLIIFGVATVLFQVIEQQISGAANTPMGVSQSLHASASGFTTTTHYVGLELVVVGAVLQIVGFLGRHSKKNAAPLEGKKSAVLQD
jgi:hypothetical protein